jgi:hypothetical protein
MNQVAWLAIGVAAGAATTGLLLLARALRTAFYDLATRIDDVLDEPDDDDEAEADEHIDDDAWDRDLRQLLTDSTG